MAVTEITKDLAKILALPPPGEIVPGHLYTRLEVCRRMGWPPTAFRLARNRGLTVRYIGKRCYVFADDLISFVQENGKERRG
jgi:hypothetical protein